ncbi:MAG TPA: MarR family transcriptional regulator [Stellaceae bacterium]|nr:MarR family transcriptional regulator [Stellaceae bacterium]
MSRTGLPGAAARISDRPEKFDFTRYLPYHLSFPVGTVSRVLASAMHSRFGLRSAHWRIMSLIGSKGPVSTRDLATYLSTEKSAISRATTDLISRGYIVRVVHPVDRRLLILHFSTRGKRLFEQMIAVALEFEQTLLETVSAEEVASLRQTLEKLRTAALAYQARSAARPARHRGGKARSAAPAIEDSAASGDDLEE